MSIWKTIIILQFPYSSHHPPSRAHVHVIGKNIFILFKYFYFSILRHFVLENNILSHVHPAV